MTFKRFDELFDALIVKCRGMRDSKGKEYANTEFDRLANFKEVGRELGADPKFVLMVLLKKHLRSIDSFIRTGKVHSETIEGRIVDAITYLGLLHGLITEEEEQAKQPEAEFSMHCQRCDKKFPLTDATQLVVCEHLGKFLWPQPVPVATIAPLDGHK